VEIGQSHALSMKPVEIRRLKHRVPMTGKIAVTLVIGHD
jgi:hypothetical protein